MNFKEFMEMYDNWNGMTKVNDNNLNTIIEDKTINIMESYHDFFTKEVIAFGFYEDTLCVRVK